MLISIVATGGIPYWEGGRYSARPHWGGHPESVKFLPAMLKYKLFKRSAAQEFVPFTNNALWCIFRRPKSLNALNEPMCKTLHQLYTDWDASPDVHAILVKGAGGKAFCAGGDVKGMVQYILAGQHNKAIRYGCEWH